MKRKKNIKKKGSKHSALSLFQKPGLKFFRPCPLSGKNAPTVDYKNIKILKNIPIYLMKFFIIYDFYFFKLCYKDLCSKDQM